MPVPSISWTDAEGAATLTNGKLISRFSGWTPDALPVGDKQNALGTGELFSYPVRDDFTARFSLDGIPNSSQALALRLQYHLRNGGKCSVTTGDRDGNVYALCGLAPGADATFEMTDRENLEYSFTVTLLNLATPRVRMVCRY